MYSLAGAPGGLGSFLAELAFLVLAVLGNARTLAVLGNTHTLLGVRVSLVLPVLLVLGLDLNKDYLLNGGFFLRKLGLMGHFNDILVEQIDGLGLSLLVMSFLFGLGVFGVGVLDFVLL